MKPNDKGYESALVSEARAAVLQQTGRNEFDAAPYERATELLESLPFTEMVDDRVQVALDITVATRTDYRPDLSRRALYAAFRTGCRLNDTRLERKWFTFTGIVEANSGNVERALKYKLVALELSQRLRDAYGFAVEWMGFANLASGAGLYEDAAHYATIAIENGGEINALWLELRGGALLNRANAWKRLGRFAECESDLCTFLTSVPHLPTVSVQNQMVMAQYLHSELHLERRDLVAARAVLHAASSWAKASGSERSNLQIERVRMRLLAFDHGMDHAVSKLQELLDEAYRIEAKSGATSYDDLVPDILHTLEHMHREHGDEAGANKWLQTIGDRLRKNAVKMLDAVADNPFLPSGSTVAAKVAEIDKYLQTRAAATPGRFGTGESSFNYLVGLAASAIAVEDPTKEHGVRVAKLSGLLTHELGLPDAFRRGIELGCLIHDVGKVSVPASILMKRVPLDASELHLYDAHTNVGAELLERLKHPEQSVLRNVVRFHHQPYAGSTPQHLPTGEAIPLEARIAAVCDEYDSLVTGRPRRPAISGNEALREIFAQRADKFDPKVVDVLVEMVRRLQRTRTDLQAYLSDEADSLEYFAMQRTLKSAAERALSTIRS